MRVCETESVHLWTVYIFFLLIGTAVGAAETDAGKEPYIQYCGSCHGEDGRSRGPVSAYLKITVPDLTLLKKNNKGIYPMDKIMSAIDGRRLVRAQGDRKMPVSLQDYA